MLNGGDGQDTLDAGDGDDVQDGGAGDDLMLGSDGGDQMDGGTGLDTVTYIDSYSGVWVSLGGGQGWNGTANGDTYASVESAVGSVFDDTLLGSQAENWLSGEKGHDSLAAGAGDDQLFGGDGDDILEGGRDQDTLVGGEGSDKLYGDSGKDMLVSQGEGDLLTGGADSDVFQFLARTTGSAQNRTDWATITDFDNVTSSDVIDLSAFRLTWLNTDPFKPDLRPAARLSDDGRDVFVEIDLDGDAQVDGVIRLEGLMTVGNLSASDFIL